MAQQSAQDVVNQSQSAGDNVSSSDAPATTSTPDIKVSGDEIGVGEVAPKENGTHTLANLKMDDLEDASGRSDTDTSRADGSVAGDKSAELKTLKKFTAKPVSFAKYSVPKVVAANAAAKGTEKVATPTSSASSLTASGRPRLVAKTTSALQTQGKPYKTATPDPMQVWNKNRVTPQPSTKHLTDEELKQQYGIHLTSRIQADGEGKEAKWADIDDDEDDWAPETIEWNDGTKSTLTPIEVVPQAKQKSAPTSDADEKPKQVAPSKPPAPHFISSVGPNATVLKLGANAERQHSQKVASLQTRAQAEKGSMGSSKSTPAVAPAKSPWATLPPVDKVSPIAINPQPVLPPQGRFSSNTYVQPPTGLSAPSPATEISADDFNRAWRDAAPGPPRELFVPTSGRYEAVPEGRRRMSRNDQGFRAPAVLQRPSQGDPHAPAEPSAAFQTHRTSADQARRRASSTVSGGSGSFGRRMSFKSGETPTSVFGPSKSDIESLVRPSSKDGPSSQMQFPTYQSRGVTEQMPAGPVPASDADLEAQRVQQRALMKENIERARRRKIEEEQRLEAEKQERIKLKLATLGPDPKLTKKHAEEDVAAGKESKKTTEETTASTGQANTHSPPKPPQPLASGEPQQYGMMKVHPLDSVKKLGGSLSRQQDSQKTTTRAKLDPAGLEDSTHEILHMPSPVANGVRSVPELRRSSGQEPVAPSEPSPKLPKPSSSGNDARSGWGDLRPDHRSPQGANLWGIPSKSALGNGTFDQGLAGYAPQDLSRTSSSAQGWINGRTPHAGRSPQTQYVNHTVPESRSFSYQPIASPDQGPLAADSEADSLFPTTKPAPIAPPHSQQAHAPGSAHGFHNGPKAHGVDAWANFHHVAGQQERAENERLQRELVSRREEELRTGVRQGPQYTFNETWKQVHVGEQAGQRHVANIAESAVPASNLFGAVGSMSGTEMGSRMMSGPGGRGSRFFPQPIGVSPHDRRAFTYSHPEPPRSPSPPPAEEYSSFHPAFDGDSRSPKVHFPPAKAVVRLPPALPPTPPSPTPVQPADASYTPLTWAARVSLPVSAPPQSFRSASTPIVQNPSWQERFNGLLGKKSSPVPETAHPAGAVLAIAPSSREPLDVQHVLVPAASVSMPVSVDAGVLVTETSIATKDVESEDDLFEDREPGSLPIIELPTGTPPLQWAPSFASRIAPAPVDPVSRHAFMVNNLREWHGPSKQQYALIRLPGQTKPTRKDIPVKSAPTNSGSRSQHRTGGNSNTTSHPGKRGRNRDGPRTRQASKAH
ncbi:hypothetical protein H2204_011641 [Knufia peltigerae]|uniref:Uncharacterized protein n=1 Tax=Knufia peltigerae TaxID=1002370 RepID=A0AA38XU20_9EURO|nr:hypothetical protein H2204_011641 [Knufia peltigerae]